MRKPSLILAVGLALAGCATSDGESQVEQTAAPTSAAETTQDGSDAGKDLSDPRELTGVSHVEDIGDPTPIEGEFVQSLPTDVVDHEGTPVTVTDTSRILALDLNGNISRTVIALGLGDSIVGRTVSSTEEQLADLPVVTQEGHSLNAEAIINLRPTVILADRSIGPPEAIQQIRSAGIPVVMLNPEHSIDTVDTEIQAVADALGLPEAGIALGERTVAEIDAAREQIAGWVPEDPIDAAFLYVRGTAGVFFILGGDQGATDLLEGVGANDIAADAGITTTTPANAEALLAVNPEVIFTMSDGLESTDGLSGLLARPGVADTIAGSRERIIVIPDGLSLSFGPQTADVLLAIAHALYGVEANG